jgi:hypothetical protein
LPEQRRSEGFAAEGGIVQNSAADSAKPLVSL